MVYTNGRAAGNSVVRGPWPARLKPLNDESLSSWLVRASLANRSTPSQLTNHIWPKWRAWTRDVDRKLDASQAKAFRQVSLLELDEIKQLLLAPIIQQITGKDHLSNSVAWPWVIQRGTRNQNTNRSTQFCPECLRTDAKPYFRLNWRLSFMTICIEHQAEFLDGCPHCGESVEIHKLKRGKLKYCAHCRWDMSDVETITCSPLTLGLTEQLTNELKSQSGAVAKLELLSFTIALVRRLTDSKSSLIDPLLIDIEAKTRDYNLFDIRRLSFDWLNTHDRRALITLAAPLVELPPKQLASIIRNSGIPMGRMNSFHPGLPSALKPYLSEESPATRCINKFQSNRDPKPAPKRLVQRRWETFLKKHGFPL